MDYGKPSRADALAAQYAAGTLRGPARRRFEALLPGHPALRDALAGWQARLLPLTQAIEPQAPPPEVWRRIERRLWPAPAAQRVRWWQRVALWRAVSGVTLASALGMALLVVNPPPSAPPVLVVLQATGDVAQPAGGFVASFSADGRSLVTRPLQAVSLRSDRVLELWSVPPQGAPKSLGLISAAGATVVSRDRLPSRLLRGQTAALAVSLEPAGGSPTGAPTGPVLYAGKLQL